MSKPVYWWCVKGKRLWSMSVCRTRKELFDKYGGNYLNEMIKLGELKVVRIRVEEVKKGGRA